MTRDRVTHLIEIGGRFFELVDTGGMGIEDVDNLTEQIEEQIQTGRRLGRTSSCSWSIRATGLMPLDQEVAKRLRYVDEPVILRGQQDRRRRRSTRRPTSSTSFGAAS